MTRTSYFQIHDKEFAVMSSIHSGQHFHDLASSIQRAIDARTEIYAFHLSSSVFNWYPALWRSRLYKQFMQPLALGKRLENFE